MQLLQNPIIKTIGITTILYFALFADKKNPESLGNRLSAERMKENFKEIQNKSQFIMRNVKAAQNHAKIQVLKKKENGQVNHSFLQISEKILNKGTGDKIAKCGDKVIIDYGILNSKGRQLYFTSSQKFTIGKRKDLLIENKLIGMKESGIKSLNIPKDFKSTNDRLKHFLETSKTDLEYQITLHNIQKDTHNSKISCN